MEPCRAGWKRIALIGYYMALLAFLSLVPMGSGAKPFSFLAAVRGDVQNVLHVPAYALPAVFWMQLLTERNRRGIGRVASAFFLAVGFGLIIESAQVWIPGRHPSLADGIVNLVGSFLGLSVYLGVERRSPGRIRRLICT